MFMRKTGSFWSRSLRLPIIQSARIALLPRYNGPLQSFLRNKQGCDIIDSGFDGFLTNPSGIKAIFEGRRDLSLIVYLNHEDAFRRVDIHKVIEVWNRSTDQRLLDNFFQQFLKKVTKAQQIRDALSSIYTQRTEGFGSRNVLNARRNHPRAPETLRFIASQTPHLPASETLRFSAPQTPPYRG